MDGNTEQKRERKRKMKRERKGERKREGQERQGRRENGVFVPGRNGGEGTRPGVHIVYVYT